MHTDYKHKFIIDELWILAWGASVQRSKLYKDPNDKSKKSEFRNYVIKFVTESIIPQYQDGTTEEQHYKNIDDLLPMQIKLIMEY